jgi:hypothetical protein
MRLTPASLVLLTAFAAPAGAFASPLYVSYTPSDSLPKAGSAISPVSPTFSAISGLTILDTAAERGGFSNAGLAQYRYLGLGRGDLSNPSIAVDTESLQPAGMFNVTAIPEPPPLLLLGTGLLFAAGAVWRFGRAKKDPGATQDSHSSKSPLQSRV